MKIQEIFDIIYTIHHSNNNSNNNNNNNNSSKVFFLRTGINLPNSKIIEMYDEIVRVVNSMGYSDPIDFIRDYFPDEDFGRIRIFKKNLELKIKVEKEDKASEEPKRSKIQSPVIEKEVVLKPIKIKRDVFQQNNEEISEIPMKERSKILKYKKMSRKFKEMEVREKEIDNKYDYFLLKKATEQTPNNTTNAMMSDNREILRDNPFIGSFYNDIDLKFREVMYKIYKYNRTQMKDKSKMTEEIEFLEEYFGNKLQLKRGEAETNLKLSNAIAYLMKKLQNKIFESEEDEVIEAMMYFKAKLCLFYNYYRK